MYLCQEIVSLNLIDSSLIELEYQEIEIHKITELGFEVHKITTTILYK